MDRADLGSSRAKGESPMRSEELAKYSFRANTTYVLQSTSPGFRPLRFGAQRVSLRSEAAKARQAGYDPEM